MFYSVLLGNLHKWVYSPRGTGLLWIAPEYQGIVRPLVTSHILNDPQFQRDYYMQGTIDNSNYMVVKEAVGFFKDMGGIVGIMATRHIAIVTVRSHHFKITITTWLTWSSKW